MPVNVKLLHPMLTWDGDGDTEEEGVGDEPIEGEADGEGEGDDDGMGRHQSSPPIHTIDGELPLGHACAVPSTTFTTNKLPGRVQLLLGGAAE